MPINKYKKQLAQIEAAIRVCEDRKRMHAPFVVYQPWSLARDQHYVTFYPEGLIQRPVRYGPLSYKNACALLNTYPGDMMLQISMSECAEWLYVFHFFSEHSALYTEEQLQRFKVAELADNPELEYLEIPDGEDIRKSMLALPQTTMIKMKHLQIAVKEN